MCVLLSLSLTSDFPFPHPPLPRLLLFPSSLARHCWSPERRPAGRGQARDWLRQPPAVPGVRRGPRRLHGRCGASLSLPKPEFAMSCLAVEAAVPFRPEFCVYWSWVCRLLLVIVWCAARQQLLHGGRLLVHQRVPGHPRLGCHHGPWYPRVPQAAGGHQGH